jgi:KaiC/GvpD/RAD55 family RecA-like ATPase
VGDNLGGSDKRR